MPVSRTLTKNSPIFQTALVCPMCQEPFLPGQIIVVCPVDQTAHHQDCWEYNDNTCANFGCSGNGFVEDPRPVAKYVLDTITSGASSLASIFTNLITTPGYTLQTFVRRALQPKAANRLSWLLVLGITYLLVTGRIQALFASTLSPPISVLLSVVLFAIFVATTYEYYRQKKLMEWRYIAAHGLSAFVLGLIGLKIADFLAMAILPNLALWDAQNIPRLNISSVMLFTITVGTATHLGAWNNPTYFKKSVYVALRLLTAFSITFYSANYLLERVDLDITNIYSDRPLQFYLYVVVGVALASALNSYLGLWLGKPRDGIRQLLETAIAAANLAALALVLGQLVWQFFLLGVLLEADMQQLSTLDTIYQYYMMGWAVLGAAYGSSEQALSSITSIYHFIVKLIWVLMVIGIVVMGGHIGYQIGNEYGIVRTDYLFGITAICALFTFIIVRAVYKFFGDIIRS